MLLNTLLAAAVLCLATTVQGCTTIPLCCDQVIYGPTATLTSTANNLGIASLTYPIGVNCVPIEDPPAQYILLWWVRFSSMKTKYLSRLLQHFPAYRSMLQGEQLG